MAWIQKLQLFTYMLCSTSRDLTSHCLISSTSLTCDLYMMNTSLFLTDLICLQILLLPYTSALLYPSIVPRYRNSFHHRHFHCSLQAWLLQLSITTWPSLRSPGSNRSRTLLHVLLSKLPNPVTSLPSSGLYSLHWLKINERIEYKLLSLTDKVLTTTSYPTFISA